ncbi:MAG: sigma-70 family RNA polymerase sigma factor [Acidobacteriaceae bacterium]|nr:sigma-70 family RNA polymerase sigma factor [Acidobacteriaceae bacterium]
MNIFGSKRVNHPVHVQYATEADFCRVFENEMDRLYLLSLLLTGNEELAQNCFVGGLEDSKNSNPVFKEWAQSWARRTIIINAIRMLAPSPDRKARVAAAEARNALRQLPAELLAVGRLETFERFVFVMSVLETYSDRECALLLNCSSSDVAAARLRAVQQLGRVAAADSKSVNAQSLSTNAPVPAVPEAMGELAATA